MRLQRNPNYAPFAEIPAMLELWYSGMWLGERMLELGASVEEVDAANFASGQMAFGHDDPWPGAESVLERWKQWRPVMPGAELAEQLLGEMFRKPP